MVDVNAVVRECRELVAEITDRAELAHTSHLLVRLGGETVFDTHLRGPVVAPVYSVTKSVVATLVGVALADGYLDDIDRPISSVLDLPPGTGTGQTVRHLLTMTRGAATGPPRDLDTLRARGRGGWTAQIARSPQLASPGAVFRYDDGGVHLLAGVVARAVGQPLAEYADDRLFRRLGVDRWSWESDPDGITIGPEGLRIDAAGLGALGALWTGGGVWRGEEVVDARFARMMTTAQVSGGPPEHRPYGFLMWIDPDGWFAGGWAGQHVTCWPTTSTVIVTTGDPRFDPGPPLHHQLHPAWLPARDLVVDRLRSFLT